MFIKHTLTPTFQLDFKPIPELYFASNSAFLFCINSSWLEIEQKSRNERATSCQARKPNSETFGPGKDMSTSTLSKHSSMYMIDEEIIWSEAKRMNWGRPFKMVFGTVSRRLVVSNSFKVTKDTSYKSTSICMCEAIGRMERRSY
ncbi:hypothetical protein GWI33_014296 [Rhynchophorus ferrugineus]|uniref:Uncharacterized protein n=1 Tax=Rhynchophorus ferrugineus TaxID=354439 RepID=A0A834I4R8_RHYFE|nr:hypothetical protein GWI33_014296 [Rhynchophorus ferrugineus]